MRKRVVYLFLLYIGTIESVLKSPLYCEDGNEPSNLLSDNPLCPELSLTCCDSSEDAALTAQLRSYVNETDDPDCYETTRLILCGQTCSRFSDYYVSAIPNGLTVCEPVCLSQQLDCVNISTAANAFDCANAPATGTDCYGEGNIPSSAEEEENSEDFLAESGLSTLELVLIGGSFVLGACTFMICLAKRTMAGNSQEFLKPQRYGNTRDDDDWGETRPDYATMAEKEPWRLVMYEASTFYKFTVYTSFLPILLVAALPLSSTWLEYVSHSGLAEDWYGDITSMQYAMVAIVLICLVVNVYGWVVARDLVQMKVRSAKWLLCYIILAHFQVPIVSFVGYQAFNQSWGWEWGITRDSDTNGEEVLWEPSACAYTLAVSFLIFVKVVMGISLATKLFAIIKGFGLV